MLNVNGLFSNVKIDEKKEFYKIIFLKCLPIGNCYHFISDFGIKSIETIIIDNEMFNSKAYE